MLTIRPDQMSVFDEQAERGFVDHLRELVKRQGAPLPPGTDDIRLTEMIRHGIARARSHGLTWESSIGKFVGLMFAVAPNFDEYPPIRAILSNPRVPPNERVALLMDRVTPEQWSGASRRYALPAWSEERHRDA